MATKKTISAAARTLGKEGGKEAVKQRKGIHAPGYKAKVRKAAANRTSPNKGGVKVQKFKKSPAKKAAPKKAAAPRKKPAAAKKKTAVKKAAKPKMKTATRKAVYAKRPKPAKQFSLFT